MTQSTSAPVIPLMDDVARQSYPAGALYVVATPIGNLADISLRALHVLGLVDAIACEDTRNTAQMLNRYGIARPLIAAHQHNEQEVAQRIIERLQHGERIALVSDAGTPAVSDPGSRIIDAVRKANQRILPLPGANAALAALMASGLHSDQFHFVGFLPSKAKQRESALLALANSRASLILYEAPHRIVETVDALASLFDGTRRMLFARELTKLFEEVHRCQIAEAPAWLAADANRLRGEYVLVIEGATGEVDTDMLEAERVLTILLAELPVKQAAHLAAQITGQKKNALYDLALKMKQEAR